MREQLLQGATRSALAQHAEDRVVTGHRAGDSRQSRLVNAPGDEVRRSRGGLDHREVLHDLDGKDELAHERGGAAITPAGPDQTQLLDVSRDRRLGCTHPAAGERRRDVLLRVRRAAIHHLEDGVVALAFGRRHGIALRIIECARSISALPMISGGTRRIEFSSTALTIRPASSHDCSNAFPRGPPTSNASLKPSPRTSLAPRSRSASWRTPPISAA